MTNPTNNHRWIPAASKPGGLVFGDHVRYGLDYDPDGDFPMVVTDADYNKGRDGRQIAVRVVCRHAQFSTGEVLRLEDLLVRIDPPAQLPESTDAFRKGWMAAAMHLQKLGDNKEHLLIEDDAEGYRRAACWLRMTIPTPTEAADGE